MEIIRIQGTYYCREGNLYFVLINGRWAKIIKADQIKRVIEAFRVRSMTL